MTEASIVPCLTTSTAATNADGVPINDYQPRPVAGVAAVRIAGLLRERCATLPNGDTAFLKRFRRTIAFRLPSADNDAEVNR